jgi:hypothetical protein
LPQERVRFCQRALTPRRVSSLQAGCVLRVPKAAATTPEGGVAALDADATLERELWRDVPAFERAKCDVERNWAYVAHVLAPLLGERHAAPGTLVMLPATFMPDVIAGAESCPGSDEQHQAQLAAGGDCRGAVAALLLPDHTLFCAPRAVPTLHKAAPVVAVEIKPKCGFLPHAPTLLQECVKRRVSRFVLHQHLKVTQGRVPKVRAAAALRSRPRHTHLLTCLPCVCRLARPGERLLPAGPIFARAGAHARRVARVARRAAK